MESESSALNPSNLADDCNVQSLALFFEVSLQILYSTTSVQVINIQGTRGMIIGHVNLARVKHFAGTKLLRNTGNVSSAVTHNTMKVPASQQIVTQSNRRNVNVPPNPAVLVDTWPDGPPPGVAFSVGAPLSALPIPAPNLGEGIPLPIFQFWCGDFIPNQIFSNFVWCGDFIQNW